MQRSWFYPAWTEPSYWWLQHILATDCWWNLEAKLFSFTLSKVRWVYGVCDQLWCLHSWLCAPIISSQHIRCNTPDGSHNLNTAHHAIMSDVTKTKKHGKKNRKDHSPHGRGRVLGWFKIKLKKYMENPEGSFFPPMC